MADKLEDLISGIGSSDFVSDFNKRVDELEPKVSHEEAEARVAREMIQETHLMAKESHRMLKALLLSIGRPTGKDAMTEEEATLAAR